MFIAQIGKSGEHQHQHANECIAVMLPEGAGKQLCRLMPTAEQNDFVLMEHPYGVESLSC